MDNKRIEYYTLFPDSLIPFLASLKEEMIEEVMTNLSVSINSNIHVRKLENAVYCLDLF